jgi:hypothetical protein
MYISLYVAADRILHLGAQRDSIGVWDDLGIHELLKIPAFPIENSADQPEICRNNNDIRLNTDLFNIFSNSGNGLSCPTRVRRIRTLLRRARVELFIQLMVGFGPNFPDFREIWLGTPNIFS